MPILFNIANAQSNINPIGGTFSRLIYNIEQVILNPLIFLLAGLALLIFLYGVFEYIQSADDPEKRKTGHDHMLWGIVGLAIMFSAYGIIYFVLHTMNGIGYGYGFGF